MAVLWIVVALSAALGVTVYAVSLRLHPRVPCRACKGSGKTRDRIWRRATGTCPKCGGAGRKPRLGVRVTSPSRARQMLAARGAHKKADKRGT
jgi:DnaJ-class molecular chaperone